MDALMKFEYSLTMLSWLPHSQELIRQLREDLAAMDPEVIIDLTSKLEAALVDIAELQEEVNLGQQKIEELQQQRDDALVDVEFAERDYHDIRIRIDPIVAEVQMLRGDVKLVSAGSTRT